MNTSLSIPADVIAEFDLDRNPPKYGLLTVDGQPKTVKGQKQGYLTAILHFAASDLSGHNVCAKASAWCRKLCLTFSGHGGIGLDSFRLNTTQMARIRRTRWFYRDRKAFMAALVHELELFLLRCEREGMIPVLRLNGTSDGRWERFGCFRKGKWYRNIFEAFPEIQGYDYTKIGRRKRSFERLGHEWPSNYHLTFSRAEDNEAATIEALENGENVAVVFDTRKGEALPPLWTIGANTYQVIDGDEDDLRFLDPAGVIVGLRAKGYLAINAEENDFVVKA